MAKGECVVLAEKIYTVAIIGCGARGMDTYGKLIAAIPDKFKIVALCDKNEEKLQMASSLFGVGKESGFLCEKGFFQRKLADILLVATQDNDHYGHIIKGLERGYDILTEKPLTASEKECKDLMEAQKKYGGKVVVCHVLRYAPAYRKIKELLDCGTIGKLVDMNMTEQVAYWHTAHSYVRGNWRKRAEATPMIIAKCCHDLDLIQYYAGAKCETVSSVGDLAFFNAENKPEGASDRCVSCKYADTCPYSAKRIYIDRWKWLGKPEIDWPFNVITNARPLTEESLTKAITEGSYGRCVFACDNDVVDHQETLMTFANDVKATLHMEGLTANMGRRYVFYGTYGEIDFFEDENVIKIKAFGKEEETIDVKALSDGGYGHGGGDHNLILDFYDVVSGNGKAETALENSIESHLIGIKAEESRLAGGKTLKVH